MSSEFKIPATAVVANPDGRFRQDESHLNKHFLLIAIIDWISPRRVVFGDLNRVSRQTDPTCGVIQDEGLVVA